MNTQDALNNLGINKPLDRVTDAECASAFKVKLQEIRLRFINASTVNERDKFSKQMKELNYDYNLIMGVIKKRGTAKNSAYAHKQTAYHTPKYSGNQSKGPQKYWAKNNSFQTLYFLNFWLKVVQIIFALTSFVIKIIVSGIKYLKNTIYPILMLNIRKIKALKLKPIRLKLKPMLIPTLVLVAVVSSIIFLPVLFKKKEYGYIVIKPYPWAELYINGKFATNTPTEEKIKVEKGENNIKLVFGTLKPIEFKVNVKENEVLVIGLNIKEKKHE